MIPLFLVSKNNNKNKCLSFPWLGIISGMLLATLDQRFLSSIPLHTIILSPSSCYPDLLMCLSGLDPKTMDGFTKTAAQFHHFPAWVKIPEFEPLCYDHLSQSNEKTDFMLLARQFLSEENIPDAVKILKSCSRFNCPLIFR